MRMHLLDVWAVDRGTRGPVGVLAAHGVRCGMGTLSPLSLHPRAMAWLGELETEPRGRVLGALMEGV
jgi:hypothetical protein